LNATAQIAPTVARILADLDKLNRQKIAAFYKEDLVGMYRNDVPFLLKLVAQKDQEIRDIKVRQLSLYVRLDKANEEVTRLQSQVEHSTYLHDVFSKPENNFENLTNEEVENES
jgi:hypothetical protein